ncbi:MAG TPA: DUF2306 domain-containing protein [Gemmatimonadales bacterium]|nr:DUF2306 domain-containing protein [Gemmatimonadales bacterium]
MLTTRSDRLIVAGLLGLGLVPAIAGVARLGGMAGHPAVTEANARFLAAPLPVVLHIISVLPFSLLGAFQFAPGFRKSQRRWHRMAGRALAPLGLVAALTGLWMTFSFPWPEPDGIVVYWERVVVGTAMTAWIVLGAVAVIRRNYAAHGDWMTRAYALGMGAGTQVFTHLPWFVLVGAPTMTSRAVMMGAGWAINALVAEWIIHRRKHPVAAARRVAAGRVQAWAS